MQKLINVNEQPVRSMLKILLKDMTTKKNIIFATDAYADHGPEYSDKSQMYSTMLDEKRGINLQPRIEKSLEEQQERTRKKAEVFTPVWLCNQMNNYLDEEWFERKNVFNTECNDHTWNVNNDKIEFLEGKTWKDYVESNRLEITCGEAPFLVSRYDSATGELILPPFRRIGLLDRKLRVINENVKTEVTWFKWVGKAFQSCYGYEYQGDSLLIARINMLLTFYDYYKDRWHKEPTYEMLESISKIIVWNIWQMDGLKDTVPLGKPAKENEQITMDLFGDLSEEDKEEAIPCRIKDWKANKTMTFMSCKR